MKINRWKDKQTKREYVFVKLNGEEALTLAISLLEQIRNDSANTGRREFNTEDNEYFSMSVAGAVRPRDKENERIVDTMVGLKEGQVEIIPLPKERHAVVKQANLKEYWEAKVGKNWGKFFKKKTATKKKQTRSSRTP